MNDCNANEVHCQICQMRCPEVIAWWNPFAGVGWNPFNAKTCDPFPRTIKTKCTNDNQVSSTCSLRCANGYMPSPELYKGYGNRKWSYTHEQLMSFSTTCSYTSDGSTVDWSAKEFSCIEKEKVMKIFYPVETHLMLAKPTSPYPENYILEIFNRDLTDEAENDEEASGARRTLMGWFAHCKYACMWENNNYKYGCRQVGIYACLACRLNNICASSRSFTG